MTEQEKINLYKRLSDAMRRSTQTMLERKAKLGESVVIADSDGNPVTISAEKALQILQNTDK